GLLTSSLRRESVRIGAFAAAHNCINRDVPERGMPVTSVITV
ncbi:MAG: hypothetical protein RJB36_918, partial [Bacteroidota bacterium]